MKRYTSSFLIAFSIYIFVGIFVFYTFKNENLIFKELEKPKTISLNQVELKEKKVVENKQTIQKQEVIKEEIINKQIPQAAKKIVEEVKKEKPIIQKKIEPKELPKKEIVEIKKEYIDNKKPLDNIEEKSSEIVENKLSNIQTNIVESKDEKKEFLDRHLAKIRELINENVIYPKRAKKLNIQGIVTIKFKILEDGNITNIEVLQGHKFLQKATIEAIQNASKLFPKVKNSIEIQIPIEFKLI